MSFFFLLPRRLFRPKNSIWGGGGDDDDGSQIRRQMIKCNEHNISIRTQMKRANDEMKLNEVTRTNCIGSVPPPGVDGGGRERQFVAQEKYFPKPSV